MSVASCRIFCMSLGLSHHMSIDDVWHRVTHSIIQENEAANRKKQQNTERKNSILFLGAGVLFIVPLNTSLSFVVVIYFDCTVAFFCLLVVIVAVHCTNSSRVEWMDVCAKNNTKQQHTHTLARERKKNAERCCAFIGMARLV